MDHINQDKTDNRAANLRVVDVWANRVNQTRSNEKRRRDGKRRKVEGSDAIEE